MTRSGARPGDPASRDEGTILPLVLVVTLVLGLVVVAVADYSAASLRFGHVAEDRSDRLAAADGTLRYAIDQVKAGSACVVDDELEVPAAVASGLNDVTVTVDCRTVGGDLEPGQLFAAVLTGEGTSNWHYLLRSQSGATPKTITGHVFMSRVDDHAFEMSAPLEIENGMLYYPDPPAPCSSLSQSFVVGESGGQLDFEPDIVYGPSCLSTTWGDLFPSPWIPDLSGLAIRDGQVSLPTDPLLGSYEDRGNCRVFEPGRYTMPPDVGGIDAYFKSGVYLFEWTDSANDEFEVVQSTALFGTPDPLLTPGGNVLSIHPDCVAEQAADTTGGRGASIYLGAESHIEVQSQGSLEIHARDQAGTPVSVQTLCGAGAAWCRTSGAPAGFVGGNGAGVAAPSTRSAYENILFTWSGNNKELVLHGQLYAPESRLEFGNVTNTAEQRMLGGLVVARAHLQSSTSATNFEIAVPASAATGRIELTAEAVKDGTTRIRAILEVRPNAADPADRVRVNSWRVCEGDC